MQLLRHIQPAPPSSRQLSSWLQAAATLVRQQCHCNQHAAAAAAQESGLLVIVVEFSGSLCRSVKFTQNASRFSFVKPPEASPAKTLDVRSITLSIEQMRTVRVRAVDSNSGDAGAADQLNTLASAWNALRANCIDHDDKPCGERLANALREQLIPQMCLLLVCTYLHRLIADVSCHCGCCAGEMVQMGNQLYLLLACTCTHFSWLCCAMFT